MQHTELLHNILDKSGAIQHKGRLKSVMTAVSSVMSGANLDLTSMGRYMNKEIKPKSKIKEIDYLLSNGHLHKERLFIYKAINEWVIGQEKLLFIAIDWSSMVAHQHHLLRASIIRKGRCITVYEEIYPESALSTGDSHQTFLRNLKRVLPENRDICIIVDAGFRTDFFIQVETENWDYVGRILSTMHYTLREEDDWKPCTSLYEQATSEPEAIGGVKLAKSNKLDSQLYLYKKFEEAVKKQPVKVRKIKHGRKEKDYRNAAKKPWLIASSLEIPAGKIMAIYKRRMKIEHDFRDSKDPKWGLGIRESRAFDPMRLILQLLIGFLASVILWLIGLCLEKKGLHCDFQANSIKHKRVLSLIFLALEAIRSGYMKFISELDFCELKQGGLDDEILSVQFL
ncbi:IS4 family transposase [Legionella sp. W05-934-2]|uniref:IS4 family transposase n=1 Tax=Legionella sp. W05-934-2 TaxID=1198649 RepID=UPI0034635750